MYHIARRGYGFVALFGAIPLVAVGAGLSKKYTETITTTRGEKLSFEMVLIPGGKFLMGSPKQEPSRKDDEGPQHVVSVKLFYLCTTETPMELFLAYYEETVRPRGESILQEPAAEDVDGITGPTPFYGDPTQGYGKRHPAVGMSWHNAMTFCRWLTMKTGKKYRLPTEAEWEHAVRAGAATAYFFSDDPAQLKDYAWFEANSGGMPHELAQKKPNPWGLYDMVGNAREWVYDYYCPTAYEKAAKNSPAVSPIGPKNGKVHVARGGDWDSPVEELRCAARAFEEKWWRMYDPQMPKSKYWLPVMHFIGFRVAR